MRYEVTPLPFKPGRLDGLSERLLVSHYENNYGGALRRLNAIGNRLKAMDFAGAAVFDINGLKREELIAANSVILHEIYFDNLGGDGDQPQGELANAIERDFGSHAEWRNEFTAMGKALGGGSGWVLLTWSARAGRLVNQWAADHAHNLAGGVPILALDMYEHAYHLDFGAKAGAYVDAFMKNLNWERSSALYRKALGSSTVDVPACGSDGRLSVETLHSMLDSKEDIVVLDCCLADDLAKRHDMIPTALLRAPESLHDWAGDLPRDKPIAVYCVYGFQVSGDVVAELRRRGLDARRVAGGIASWHAIAGPVVPIPPSDKGVSS
jgi:Fe-Mn family superoxide dismutase